MGERAKYPWRVMISSTMLDLQSEREVAWHVIAEAGLAPWYAERPPREFEVSGYQLSIEMARRCDLYLLIVGSRYGSRPEGMPPGDTRSVTHLEFDTARDANPRKIRVFVPTDAETIADSEQEREFLRSVMHFSQGTHYYVYDRHDLTTLRAQLAHTINQWLDPAGRDAYIAGIQQDYALFRNPVTGAEMDYDATVLLKLRSEVGATNERTDWEGQVEDEDRGRRDHLGSHSKRHARSIEEREASNTEVAATSLIAEVGDFLRQFGHLALLGDVGSGKSTLLRRLAHDTASEYLRQRTPNPRIPVLVRAADLGRIGRQQPELALSEALGALQEEVTQAEGLKPLIRAVVAEAVSRGEAIVLVDGLDEAPQTEQRVVVALLRQIGSNHSILASRPAAYHHDLANWCTCDLQRLDATQRRQLILQAFRAIAGDDEELPDPESLERELDVRADLFVWAGNPLLLTLIATQYTRDRRLPENRARIYQFAIEDMQHQRQPTARRRLTQDELDHLLRTLALRMLEASTRFASTEEVYSRYLAEELSRYSPSTGDISRTAPALALEVLERSGVLQMQGDRWEFLHLSFQEYLSAAGLATQNQLVRRSLAQRRCLSARWHQVFLLLVSLLDSEGRYADTDALLHDLIAADRQRIPLLQGPDPCHLALRLATQCHFSRTVAAKQYVLLSALRSAWRPLWRQNIRGNQRGFDVNVIDSWLDNTIDVGVGSAFFYDMYRFRPTALSLEAGQVLFEEVLKEKRWPRPGAFVPVLLLSVLCIVLLFFLAQAVLIIGPLHATVFGHTVLHWLPTVLTGALGLYIMSRLLMFGASRRELALRSLRVEHRFFRTLSRETAMRALNSLQSLLRDKDVRGTKIEIVAALGQVVPEAALQILLPLVRDNYSTTDQLAAIRAVADLGPAVAEHTVPDLASLIRDQEVLPYNYRIYEPAADALAALGFVDTKYVVPAVIELLNVDDSRVQENALRALKGLGPAAADSALPVLLALRKERRAHTYPLNDYEAANTIAALVPNIPEYTLRTLLALIDQDDKNVRQLATQTIMGGGRSGDFVLLFLGLGFESGLLSSVGQGLWTLGTETVDATLVSLVALLYDDAADVRARAAQKVGVLGREAPQKSLPERILPALLVLFHDDSHQVRAEAAEAVRWFRRTAAENACAALVLLLRDESWRVRRSAAETLAQLGCVDEQILGELRRLLNDPDGGVRVHASGALWTLTAVASKEALPVLLDALQHGDSGVRGMAAATLGEVGGPVAEQVVAALAPLLSDNDQWSKRCSEQAICELAPALVRRSLGACLPLLDFDERGVRSAYAEAISKLGPDEVEQNAAELVLPGLLRMLWRHNETQQAATAIAALGIPIAKQALPELLIALRDPNRWTREAAFKAIGMLGPAIPDQVTPMLVEMLNDNGHALFPQDEEGKSYGQRYDDWVANVTNALHALERLGESAGEQALPVVVRWLTSFDRSVKNAAADAVRAFGPLPAERVLPGLLRHRDSSVRSAAAQALVELGTSLPASMIPDLLTLLRKWRGPGLDGVVRAIAAQSSRLSSADVEYLANWARRPRWMWGLRLVSAFRWLCDAPVLLLAMSAQIVILLPLLQSHDLVSSHFHILTEITSWWQVGLLLIVYLYTYSISTTVLQVLGGAQRIVGDRLLSALEDALGRLDDSTKLEFETPNA